MIIKINNCGALRAKKPCALYGILTLGVMPDMCDVSGISHRPSLFDQQLIFRSLFCVPFQYSYKYYNPNTSFFFLFLSVSDASQLYLNNWQCQAVRRINEMRPKGCAKEWDHTWCINTFKKGTHCHPEVKIVPCKHVQQYLPFWHWKFHIFFQHNLNKSHINWSNLPACHI